MGGGQGGAEGGPRLAGFEPCVIPAAASSLLASVSSAVKWVSLTSQRSNVDGHPPGAVLCSTGDSNQSAPHTGAVR